MVLNLSNHRPSLNHVGLPSHFWCWPWVNTLARETDNNGGGGVMWLMLFGGRCGSFQALRLRKYPWEEWWRPLKRVGVPCRSATVEISTRDWDNPEVSLTTAECKLEWAPIFINGCSDNIVLQDQHLTIRVYIKEIVFTKLYWLHHGRWSNFIKYSFVRFLRNGHFLKKERASIKTDDAWRGDHYKVPIVTFTGWGVEVWTVPTIR